MKTTDWGKAASSVAVCVAVGFIVWMTGNPHPTWGLLIVPIIYHKVFS